jgi:hypothetical protein
LAGVLALAGAFGCSQEPSGSGSGPLAPNAAGPLRASEPALARVALPFDSGNFVTVVDNIYFPLTPGSVYRYREETDEGVETNVVEVTHATKEILGVAATVVRDRVYLEGALKEDTFDWYAQDRQGNVWYMGEDTKEHESGEVVSTAGSWEAGRRGGRHMFADPKIGDHNTRRTPRRRGGSGKVSA